MFEFHRIPYASKTDFYRELRQELKGLYNAFWLSNLANASATLMAHLPELNWAGFYLFADGELKLGPFQGLPACLNIPLGKGVCGTAAQTRETLVVADVHAFPGHIACDARSRAEIVVPLLYDGILYGVLDLDSPEPARFDGQDREGLELLVQDLLRAAQLPQSWDSSSSS